MPCFNPIKGYRAASGFVSSAHRRHGETETMSVACGQCSGCRLARSASWATRIMHEAALWPASSFVTFTYDEEHLPRDMSLHHEHFQLFMKRLRFFFNGEPLRYYMCGEYGELNQRPHYHACMFNFDMPDKKLISNKEYKLYMSPKLTELWGFGFCSMGDLTFESAQYVAKYIMAKVTGDIAEDHYRYVDVETGEVFMRAPEYNRMSLKPGIGAKWLEKFRSDVYPSGKVIVRGKERNAPKYYDRLQKKHDELLYDDAFQRKALFAEAHLYEGSPERLEVKRRIVEQRLKESKRNL